jgi:hypothetical protein
MLNSEVEYVMTNDTNLFDEISFLSERRSDIRLRIPLLFTSVISDTVHTER